ncbi:MAG: hypothetical protein WCI97_04870 [Bacteroidota bacterium]
MTVNPNLATLMRVIEDQQDKMPEGEYLQAMNALGALHRTVAAPVAAPVTIPIIQAPMQLFDDNFHRIFAYLGRNGYHENGYRDTS